MVIDAQRISVDAFDKLVFLPENADKLLEYIGSEVVVKVVSNNRPSRVAMLIGSYMTIYAQQNDLGRTTGSDGGYRVNGERYIPDAAFISKTRQPDPNADAYNPLAPDLAIEVLSPSDDMKHVRIKLTNYLLAGTVVWLVDPEQGHIEVYEPGQKPRVLTAADTLEGGTVLPGFSLPLKGVFT